VFGSGANLHSDSMEIPLCCLSASSRLAGCVCRWHVFLATQASKPGEGWGVKQPAGHRALEQLFFLA